MAFEIKTVGSEDYDKVIAIRKDNYGGFDYLPALYHELIDNPACTGYVAVKDGEYVAFTLTMLTDGGNTFIPRASRVRKDCEGKGLFQKFKELVIELFSQGAQRYVSLFDDTNNRLLNKAKSEKSLFLSKNIFMYELRSESEQQLQFTGDGCGMTKPLKTDDLRAIFNSTKICRYLFPDGLIVCNWVPFRLIESNIPLLMTRSALVLGSFTPDCSLFTCGNSYPCDRGVICHIDVYGTNVKYLNEHIKINLKHCTEMVVEGGVYVFVYSKDAAKDVVNDITRQHGLQPLYPQPFYKSLMMQKQLGDQI